MSWRGGRPQPADPCSRRASNPRDVCIRWSEDSPHGPTKARMTYRDRKRMANTVGQRHRHDDTHTQGRVTQKRNQFVTATASDVTTTKQQRGRGVVCEMRESASRSEPCHPAAHKQRRATLTLTYGTCCPRLTAPTLHWPGNETCRFSPKTITVWCFAEFCLEERETNGSNRDRSWLGSSTAIQSGRGGPSSP